MFTKKLIVVLLFLFLIIIFFPHPFVKDSNSIKFIKITYQGEQFSLSENQYVQVKNIISLVWCRRSFGYSHKVTNLNKLEIDFIADDKPCHIVLGEQNYCYHSAGIFQEYTILNNRKIIDLFSEI